jgi:hypothetical protein
LSCANSFSLQIEPFDIRIRKRGGMDCCWSKIQAKAVAKEETGGRETGRARKRKKKPSKINLIRYQKGSAEWHGSEDG